MFCGVDSVIDPAPLVTVTWFAVPVSAAKMGAAAVDPIINCPLVAPKEEDAVKSLATNRRKVGVPLDPAGEAKIAFAVACEVRDKANVPPAAVNGEPETLKKDGTVMATLIAFETLNVPAPAVMVMPAFPAPTEAATGAAPVDPIKS